MASKVKGLECPICLDVFKDPTILSCGHTFCKGCLEACDEQHHLEHLVCPVCRKNTKLGETGVSGLTPNISVKGLEDILDVDVDKRSQNFCSLHSQLYKDIFCEDCGEFICLTCYIDHHKHHKIRKKEELEGYLRNKTETLIQNSKARKTEIEKSVNNVQQQKIDMHSHFNNVEKAIRAEFAKKVAVLQKNEETLLKKLDSIRKDTENQVEGCIANHRKVIDSINRSAVLLRGYTGKNLDVHTIKAQDSQYNDLEESLTKIIDEGSMVSLKQTAASTRFCPSDKKLLVLGHIEVGMKGKSNIQHVKTAASANKKPNQVQTSRNVAVIPSLLKSKSLNIVKMVMVNVSDLVIGMAALSQDSVVIGYGYNEHGTECFSVSGEKKQHLNSEVGEVWDIAFLTDGRSVVSQDCHTLSVYNTQDTHGRAMQYTCKKGEIPTRLCSDHHDNIFAVNGNPEVYIFHGRKTCPQRVVPTGDIKPRQICVTKTGVMITSTCDVTPSTVTVFDREGHVGSSITASDDNEYLYAAVDSHDRVLVARVRQGYHVFRLTRYTLQGTTLIEHMSCKELTLPFAISMLSSYCYMTSLAPKLLVFDNCNNLYFIELSA